jgi:hypothetical protein
VPYTGVYYDIVRQCYTARLTRKGKAYAIGHYSTAIEASESRKKFIEELIRLEKHIPIRQETKSTPIKPRFYKSTFELDAA